MTSPQQSTHKILRVILCLVALLAGCSSIPALFPMPPITPTVHVPQVSNGLIAYIVGDPDTTFHIYTMNPDGTNKQRLIEDTDYDSGPVWAPDGKHILFSSHCLQLMSFQSKDRRCMFDIKVLLGESYGFKEYPIWSPDGTKIAFLAGQTAGYGSSSIYVMNMDGSDLHEVSQRIYARWPSWSPDSKRIAFSDPADYVGGIHIVNVDGSDYHELEDSGYESTRPFWSEDGSRIFYQAKGMSERAGGNRVAVINTDGTNAHLLIAPENAGDQFFWGISPDGSKMLLTAESWQGKKGTHVVIIDANDYSVVYAFERDIDSDFSQDIMWAPDSQKIIYRKELYEGYFVTNIDGSGEYSLDIPYQYGDAISWQPVWK